MSSGPAAWSQKWPGTPSELLWQLRRFHSFIWASGGLYSDFYIHHIDHLCWMKNAWPVMAQGIGGRHYRGESVDQNFDNYAVEYTFADGSKMYMDGRHMGGVEPRYYTRVHGSKGVAIAARNGDNGGPSSIFKGQNESSDNRLWVSEVPADQSNAYDNEWVSLVEAIRNNTPYNEVKRGVEASVVTSMGRVSAHTGQAITFEEMLNSDHEYAPDADKWTMDSPPPLKSDANGKYPIPMPGLLRKREYEPQV
jgi:predicted dehydrogenase